MISINYHLTQQFGKRPVEVFAGWDRPLGTYFLDVTIPSTDPKKEDEIIYCSMDDVEAPRSSDWEYFAKKLIQLGITIPAEMSDALDIDARLNMGNIATRW